MDPFLRSLPTTIKASAPVPAPIPVPCRGRLATGHTVYLGGQWDLVRK